MRFRDRWSAIAKDFRTNFRNGWPIFAGLTAFVLVSAGVLDLVEPVGGYSLAVYLTWSTMTTIGNTGAQTPAGRVLTGVDALAGLVLLGTVVWIVTQSLLRPSPAPISAKSVPRQGSAEHPGSIVPATAEGLRWIRDEIERLLADLPNTEGSQGSRGLRDRRQRRLQYTSTAAPPGHVACAGDGRLGFCGETASLIAG